MADKDLRLWIANNLALVDELLELELKDNQVPAHEAQGRLLQLELKAVLRHARDFAGLNPDGSFDKVPKPRPPAKPKGAGK